MKRYIIVKYAETNFCGKAPIQCSVFGTYSACECGIIKETYHSIKEAEADLKILDDFNPSVGYGIVELEARRRVVKEHNDKSPTH